MLVYFPYRNAIETAHFTKSDEEPISFTLVRSEADPMRCACGTSVLDTMYEPSYTRAPLALPV
jgi:hypothetical protein